MKVMTMHENSDEQLMREDLQRSLVGGPVDPGNLTPFQRILLTTDGLVTEMLEANYWERMIVDRIFQEGREAIHAIPELDCAPGEFILNRRILLRGRMSHVARIYAESIIMRDRLPEPIRIGLETSQKPIGHLILENRLETFREILGCVKEKAGALAGYFNNILPTDYLIARRYRVIVGGQPIMLITEKFPEQDNSNGSYHGK